MVLPGRRHGTGGSVTCDHHHRWPEDVALMKRLVTDGHRLGSVLVRLIQSVP